MENKVVKMQKPVHENLYYKIMNTKTFKSAWYQSLKSMKGEDTWSLACSQLIEFWEGDIESSIHSETKKRKAFLDVRFVMIAFCQWLDSHHRTCVVTDINFRRRFKQFKKTLVHHGMVDNWNELTWETPVMKLNGIFMTK